MGWRDNATPAQLVLPVPCHASATGAPTICPLQVYCPAGELLLRRMKNLAGGADSKFPDLAVIDVVRYGGRRNPCAAGGGNSGAARI
ncbi:hypothetical protein E2562_027748 [Oryza meyeriana var. granulata]|uniref:Uncharacterized protein n=1 Tax=Oryza meyeriana var. granulata TaxID=110450 RepID=A0A6G1EQI8_9ORYZ|nr:hypothetical protein E2562_027748 [Oryza meyeriana var. granulata]